MPLSWLHSPFDFCWNKSAEILPDSGEINWWTKEESQAMFVPAAPLSLLLFFLCVFCFSSHPYWQKPVCMARHRAATEKHFRCVCLTSHNLLPWCHSLQGIWKKGKDSCSGQLVSPARQPLPWLSHAHMTRGCFQTSCPVPCAQEEGKQGLTPQRWFLHQQHPLRKAMNVTEVPFY